MTSKTDSPKGTGLPVIFLGSSPKTPRMHPPDLFGEVASSDLAKHCKNGRQRAAAQKPSPERVGSRFSAYAFTGGNIKIILDALSTITKVDVLSSPQLMVLNNQTATLQVGYQVPIITQQAVSTETSGAPVVNSVQYENTGVILQVTPRVNRGGEVMMDITQEVSDVSSTVTSSTGSPMIEQRKITSTVAVQDGETVTLGGLISKQNSTAKVGVPFLDQIPVLGNAFRDTSNGFTRTELLVLITPHVVDSVQRARAVTAELRRKLPLVQPLLEEPR